MCTIPALMAGTTIVGTGLSMFGKISQGRTAEALAEAQAQAIEQQREAERRASNFEIAGSERQFQARQGEAIAQVAASGVGLAGSPSDVLAANAGEHQLDIEAIRYGSLLKQGQLQTQADITRWQGGEEKRASYIGAATDAISGFGSMFDPTKSIRFGRSMFAPSPPSYSGLA